MQTADFTYLPKDFIETAEGLLFAVVQQGVEQSGGQDKVLCFLRYVKAGGDLQQPWRKVDTDTANELLTKEHPEYRHYSALLDTALHGVPVNKIIAHYRPRRRLQQLLKQQNHDEVEQDCRMLCSLLIRSGIDIDQVGVTGSLLIGAQRSTSDIDLVIYDRQIFYQARNAVATLIERGELLGLSQENWREAFARRGCALNFEDYVWHEKRKFNKGMINGRKFDLGLLTLSGINDSETYRKAGAITVQGKVTEDTYGFDYPAMWFIDYPAIPQVLCFTATYAGQALTGETIEAAGMLEQSGTGRQRIVVGSSREAPGEYIKVIESCRR